MDDLTLLESTLWRVVPRDDRLKSRLQVVRACMTEQ